MWKLKLSFHINLLMGSSENSDDLWDCSSNEGGDKSSEEDSSDDTISEVQKRDAKMKFGFVTQAEKAFAAMIDRLQKKMPLVSDSQTIACAERNKDKGTWLRNASGHQFSNLHVIFSQTFCKHILYIQLLQIDVFL